MPDTTERQPPIPPGWYLDPKSGRRARWWEGDRWLSVTKPTAIGFKDPPLPQGIGISEGCVSDLIALNGSKPT